MKTPDALRITAVANDGSHRSLYPIMLRDGEDRPRGPRGGNRNAQRWRMTREDAYTLIEELLVMIQVTEGKEL
jgi:hypothetical protein